jgi:hypothetical protein
MWYASKIKGSVNIIANAKTIKFAILKIIPSYKILFNLGDTCHIPRLIINLLFN